MRLKLLSLPLILSMNCSPLAYAETAQVDIETHQQKTAELAQRIRDVFRSAYQTHRRVANFVSDLEVHTDIQDELTPLALREKEALHALHERLAAVEEALIDESRAIENEVAIAKTTPIKGQVRRLRLLQTVLKDHIRDIRAEREEAQALLSTLDHLLATQNTLDIAAEIQEERANEAEVQTTAATEFDEELQEEDPLGGAPLSRAPLSLHPLMYSEPLAGVERSPEERDEVLVKTEVEPSVESKSVAEDTVPPEEKDEVLAKTVAELSVESKPIAETTVPPEAKDEVLAETEAELSVKSKPVAEATVPPEAKDEVLAKTEAEPSVESTPVAETTVPPEEKDEVLAKTEAELEFESALRAHAESLPEPTDVPEIALFPQVNPPLPAIKPPEAVKEAFKDTDVESKSTLAVETQNIQPKPPTPKPAETLLAAALKDDEPDFTLPEDFLSLEAETQEDSTPKPIETQHAVIRPDPRPTSQDKEVTKPLTQPAEKSTAEVHSQTWPDLGQHKAPVPPIPPLKADHLRAQYELPPRAYDQDAAFLSVETLESVATEMEQRPEAYADLEPMEEDFNEPSPTAADAIDQATPWQPGDSSPSPLAKLTLDQGASAFKWYVFSAINRGLYKNPEMEFEIVEYSNDRAASSAREVKVILESLGVNPTKLHVRRAALKEKEPQVHIYPKP